MHTHHQTSRTSLNKRCLPTRADGNCFLRQKRSADAGIHITKDHTNVRDVLQNTKKTSEAIQNKRRGMVKSGVVLPHNIPTPHTAARTRAPLEHFNWELFDQPCYSPDCAPSDYHPFTYLKNWLGSQSFKKNELLEGVKHG
jgi:hypothetical protein